MPPAGSLSPTLPPAQYSLPVAVGKLFDATVLSSDALRPLADEWCRRVVDCLRAAGSVVTPLRAAAEERREQAKAAARVAERAAPLAVSAASGRRRVAEAAAPAAVRAAQAAPLANGRGRARAEIVKDTARAARAAPSATGRHRTASKP